ncbi:MAG: hypothetical protein JNK64_01930 [Myxococcales bacterium]|nr:hypothetical protein [Myxococcales bacterium]
MRPTIISSRARFHHTGGPRRLRWTGALPALPPGTVVHAIGPDAITERLSNVADLAHAATSDAWDGRDGVDPSDCDLPARSMIPIACTLASAGRRGRR